MASSFSTAPTPWLSPPRRYRSCSLTWVQADRVHRLPDPAMRSPYRRPGEPDHQSADRRRRNDSQKSVCSSATGCSAAIGRPRFRLDASWLSILPITHPWAKLGLSLTIHRELLLPTTETDRWLSTRSAAPRSPTSESFRASLPETLESFLQPPLEGAVLHTYGSGNAPDRAELLAVLRAGERRAAWCLVNCTQCLEGTVKMSAYATGSALADVGVVSGQRHELQKRH